LLVTIDVWRCTCQIVCVRWNVFFFIFFFPSFFFLSLCYSLACILEHVYRNSSNPQFFFSVRFLLRFFFKYFLSTIEQQKTWSCMWLYEKQFLQVYVHIYKNEDHLLQCHTMKKNEWISVLWSFFKTEIIIKKRKIKSYRRFIRTHINDQW
jgi:hypothetical protein